MGMIRGGLLFLASFLFVISLFGGNLFLTLSLSLEYNDFRSELISNFVEISGGDLNLTKEVEDNFYSLEEDCETNENLIFEYGEYVIDLPCEVVDKGPEAVTNWGVDNVVEIAIEEAYPDSLLASGLPELLLSENSSDYWKSYFYTALFISFILIVLMFFLIEKKTNVLILVGFLVLISSLPFIIINFLLPFLENSFLRPISLLFSEAYTVFLIVFMFGISLIVFGFGLKFFKIGWSLSTKFRKIREIFSRGKGFKKTETKV